MNEHISPQRYRATGEWDEFDEPKIFGVNRRKTRGVEEICTHLCSSVAKQNLLYYVLLITSAV